MTRVRVALLSAAALGTALLVSGCGAGQISQTAEMQPAVPGANSTFTPGGDNSIQLRNVMLAYPGVDGYQQGANAPLLLHIFNTGSAPVTLVQVETDAAAAVTLRGGPVASGVASPSPGATAAHPQNPPAANGSPSESPSAPPSGTSPGAAGTASPGAAAGTAPAGGRPVRVVVPVNGFVALSPSAGTSLQLDGLTRAVRVGEAVTITFTFDTGARYTLDVPIAVPSAPAPQGSAVADVRGGE